MIVSNNSIIYVQEEDGNATDSDMPKFFAIQHAQSCSPSEVNATTNFLELHDVSNLSYSQIDQTGL